LEQWCDNGGILRNNVGKGGKERWALFLVVLFGAAGGDR
jgi:hypothetical protein